MIPGDALPQLPDYPGPGLGLRLPALAVSLAMVASLVRALGLSGGQGGVPPGRASRGVSIRLREGQAPEYAPSPDPRPGPAGGSSRLGTGNIDPGLMKLPCLRVVRTPPPVLPDPLAVDLPEAKQAQAQDLPALPRELALDKSLPLRLGGNGAFQGDGEGFGRGHGNGLGDGSGGGAQGGLRLLKSVGIVHQGQRGDSPLQGRTVKVRLWIGPDGVPIQAELLSGPPRVYEEVRQAALDWRFEVPAHLKARAPIPVLIDFRFKTVWERR